MLAIAKSLVVIQNRVMDIGDVVRMFMARMYVYVGQVLAYRH